MSEHSKTVQIRIVRDTCAVGYATIYCHNKEYLRFDGIGLIIKKLGSGEGAIFITIGIDEKCNGTIRKITSEDLGSLPKFNGLYFDIESLDRVMVNTLKGKFYERNDM